MPMDREKYPDNWPEIRKEVRDRSGNCCELCGAENKRPHWKTGSKVVLTVHHIDGVKSNNNMLNLLHLCQRCHLRLDLEHHVKNRKNGGPKLDMKIKAMINIDKMEIRAIINSDDYRFDIPDKKMLYEAIENVIKKFTERR